MMQSIISVQDAKFWYTERVFRLPQFRIFKLHLGLRA